MTGVFFGYDFITVTKADGEWQHLKPAILGAIMEHFMTGAPLFANGYGATRPRTARSSSIAEDASTVETIKELLETRIRPAVAGDGGDITFRGFKDGTVYLVMKGACSGCPSSTATLAPRHPEPAAPLPAGRARGAGGLTSPFDSHLTLQLSKRGPFEPRFFFASAPAALRLRGILHHRVTHAGATIRSTRPIMADLNSAGSERGGAVSALCRSPISGFPSLRFML